MERLKQLVKLVRANPLIVWAACAMMLGFVLLVLALLTTI